MNVSLADFFVSSWIWHVTFDWMHPLVAGMILYLFLRILKNSRITSVLISLTAQIFAFGLLTGIVSTSFIANINLQFDTLSHQQVLMMLNEFYPSLSLALLYAFFQSIYFLLARVFKQYRLRGYLVAVWISNGIAFAISVMLIRIIRYWYYG